MKSTLEKIYQSVEKFLTPLTVEETYKKTVGELMRLTGADGGIINMYKNNAWKRVYSSHNFPKTRTRKRGFTYRAFKSGKPLIICRDEVINIHPQLKKFNFRWNIFLPLTYSKKSLGVVILMHTKGKPPDEKGLAMLKIFGSLATLAIRKTQLYKEIKDTLDERELFISMAAHELKTPLTTINAYVQLFQQLPNKGSINAKWIEQLSKATDRLKKLVSELLQIEQIKKGKLEYQVEETNLLKLIQQAINDFKLFNPKHKILFINNLINKDAFVLADFDKLLQAFNNVLNNSGKYSKEGSEITITIDHKELYYIIRIQDKGEGISRKDLSQIFEKYFKGEQKNKEGLGLGLFLTKRIITEHQGAIEINSQKNLGTIVKITLPVK